MTRLLRAERPGPAALTLLALGALMVLVAGFEHARLFHRGYAAVDVVGPLFLLNAIGSTLVVLLLIFDRVALFVLGAISISVGSVVSIFISHTSSFFQFSEASYDTSATVIVVAEIAATVLVLAGAALGARDQKEATA